MLRSVASKTFALLAISGAVFASLYTALHRRALASERSNSAVVFDRRVITREVDPTQSSLPIKVEFEFPFHNQTDHTIEVEKIRSTCSCTVAQLESMTIAPQKSSTVHVTMNVTSVGSSSQQVAIKLRGEANPIVLECLAHYDPKVFVSVAPREPHFSASGGEIRATVLSVGHTSAKLKSLKSSSSDVRIELISAEESPVRMGGGRWESWLTFRVIPSANFHGQTEFTLGFDDPTVPETRATATID